MRATLAAGLAAMMSGPALAYDLPAEVAADYPALEALYIHFHQNPELSFKEEATADRLAAELKGLGFEVTEGVGGTGVVAVMKNGAGPTLMLRADMDALPIEEKTGLPFASKARGVTREGAESAVMHACGHDVHMTALIGAARRLAADASRWSGTLVLIGQPAEELGLGAEAMIKDGLYTRFPKPDFNVALHDSAELPAGVVAYTPGYALANVDSVDITVKGVGGHGAYPHRAKDPVVIAAQIVLALQTLVSRETSPLDSAVVTVGSIHGGTKHNIIGAEVKLQLTVRSYADETRARLLDGVKRIARAQAVSAGLPDALMPVVEVEEPYTPATYNDPALSERVAAAIADVIGADNVRKADPVMGGEDFSQFGRTPEKIPGVIFWVGAVEPSRWAKAQERGEPLASLHSPFFAPDREKTLTTATIALTAAALDLLAKKE